MHLLFESFDFAFAFIMLQKWLLFYFATVSTAFSSMSLNGHFSFGQILGTQEAPRFNSMFHHAAHAPTIRRTAP